MCVILTEWSRRGLQAWHGCRASETREKMLNAWAHNLISSNQLTQGAAPEQDRPRPAADYNLIAVTMHFKVET
jgi:hypothetical protein